MNNDELRLIIREELNPIKHGLTRFQEDCEEYFDLIDKYKAVLDEQVRRLDQLVGNKEDEWEGLVEDMQDMRNDIECMKVDTARKLKQIIGLIVID